MENKETPKFGIDPDGVFKRRISSILKAPRMSMKRIGSEQDEQDETKPIEKRRNSRRVSFATTDNVRVFAKDLKAESPVLTPVENLTAGASGEQNRRLTQFNGSEEGQIAGQDPFLSMSLLSSLPKENFFPDVFLQDGPMDRTVLHGEDTGHMDMTYSHTICIDKGDANSPELTLNTSANVSGLHSFKTSNARPCKTVVDMEFFNFLSSLSNTKPDPFARSNTSEVEMDKENLLPSHLTQQLQRPSGSANQGQRCRSLSFEQNMDMTQSHTAVIDRREILQPVPYSSAQHRSKTDSTSWFTKDSDDMELTRSQTATINFKTMGDVPSADYCRSADHCRSALVSDDTTEMVMTQTIDFIEPNQKAMSFQTRNAFSTQPDIGQPSKTTSGNLFQSRGPFPPIDNCDDMEITQSQTVVLETKYGGEPSTPQASSTSDRVVGLDISGTVHASTQEGEGNARTDTTFNDKSKFMELTCQTLVVSHSPDDMDLTRCASIVQDYGKTLSTSKASFVPPSVLSETINQCVDDMEMTQCQTIVLDTKPYRAASPFAEPRKVSVSVASDLRERPSVFDRQDVPDCRDSERVSPFDTLVAHADMELTGCRSVAIEAKDIWEALDLPQSSSIRPPNMDKMELSERVVEKPPDVDPTSVVNHNDSVDDMNLTKVQPDLPTNYEVPSPKGSKEKPRLDFTTTNIYDCSMEITGQPFEDQCGLSFNKTQISKEPVSGTMGQDLKVEMDRTLTFVGALKNQPRRKSIAELQMRLQSIAQCIGKPEGVLTCNVTAPIASFTGAPSSDHHEIHLSSEQSPKEMPTFKNKAICTLQEVSAPLNLKKNSLLAKLSLGGVTPKLPQKRFPTETKTLSSRQSLPSLETTLYCSHDIDLLDNEVFPEEAWLGPVVGETEDESKTWNAEERQRTETVLTSSQRDEAPVETRNAMTENLDAASFLTRVVCDSSSSSSSTSMKYEGVSESTLKSSQLDLQVETTLESDFDFYKKLEDGSLTAAELLKHFGAKCEIHKSRPSVRPDNFGAFPTRTVRDALEDKHILYPKKRVYEADCQRLTEIAEGLKAHVAEQHKPLRNFNCVLLRDLCTFSQVQLQRFGARLKEQRLYFRKSSKAHSHEMKKVLFSELLNTTREAKEAMGGKIEETNKLLKELDVCLTDLESELEGMSDVVRVGDQDFLIRTTPALKTKQDDVDALKSELAEREKEICQLELQAQTLKETQGKLRMETAGLKHCTSTLNSLNEWRFSGKDENRLVFTFLHDTVQLEIKPKNPTETEWTSEDAAQEGDVSWKFLLNAESSQCHAVMVHRLLAQYVQAQNNWTTKPLTTPHVPLLLHDVSLVVSRLRLLGEEIHQLKKWGGLKFAILRLTCVDTSVEITFSSVRASAKFQLRLAVTPDYPFRPLRVQNFQSYLGDTRTEQVDEILSSVTPAKDYLTRVIGRIHSDLLG